METGGPSSFRFLKERARGRVEPKLRISSEPQSRWRRRERSPGGLSHQKRFDQGGEAWEGPRDWESMDLTYPEPMTRLAWDSCSRLQRSGFPRDRQHPRMFTKFTSENQKLFQEINSFFQIVQFHFAVFAFLESFPLLIAKKWDPIKTQPTSTI